MLMCKRIFSALMSVVLLITCLSGITFAADKITQVQVETKLSELVNTYDGKQFTDSFNGATQCKGFADMIYASLFEGTNIGPYPEGIYYYLNLTSIGTQEIGRLTNYAKTDGQTMADLLKEAAPGDYIQMRRRDKAQAHSMIVLSAEADGLYVFHSNWTTALQNEVRFFSWQQFAAISDGISLYHYKNYLKGGEFVDVKNTAWYYNDVRQVAELGWMTGTTPTTFEPDTKMTRAMLVSVLYRMSDDGGKYATDCFTDVAAGTWYSDAVGWAVTATVVAGYPDGSFRPNASITREETAAVLYRYAEYVGKDIGLSGDLTQFKDANKISNYAKSAMSWAVGNGVLTGNTDKTLQPQGFATRAHVAKMIVNLQK